MLWKPTIHHAICFYIEGLVFTKADSNIIKECYLNKGFYQSFSENLMMRWYEVAQVRGNRSVMKTSFWEKNRPSLDSSIERLSSTMVIALYQTFHATKNGLITEVQIFRKIPQECFTHFVCPKIERAWSGCKQTNRNTKRVRSGHWNTTNIYDGFLRAVRDRTRASKLV